ncbi:hypothetical protein OKW38_004399 [Paraburkholderia sp. MM5496-R1]
MLGSQIRLRLHEIHETLNQAPSSTYLALPKFENRPAGVLEGRQRTSIALLIR